MGATIAILLVDAWLIFVLGVAWGSNRTERAMRKKYGL